MYSLRRALALRFSITMFVALLLIALWAYWGADRVIREQLDRAIESTLILHATELRHQHRIDQTLYESDYEGFIDVVNRFVILRDADGGIIDHNTAHSSDLPISHEGFIRASEGDTVWITQVWEGRGLRSVYAPAPDGSPPGASTIQVTASLEPLSASERRILFLILGTAVLGSLATIIGATWLATSASAPVLEIANQAEAIRDTSEGRITVHGDVEEYERLIGVLNGMLDRLREAYRAQQRMIADIGHDLRTPITALHGSIEIALRHERSADEYRRTLKSILEDADSLESICNSLIALATVESSDSLQRGPVSFAQIARAIAEEKAVRAPDHHIEVADDADDLMLSGDETMLRRLVDELLQNAIHHTPEGTRVTIRLSRVGHDAELRVEDDGPGIPSEALPFIFDRLYRVDPARSGPRAGLGLTLARAVARAHGGSIEAYAPTDGGLCVRVTLPLADREALAPAQSA